MNPESNLNVFSADGVLERPLRGSETTDSPRRNPVAGGDAQKHERLCWMCLETEAENRLAQWVQPCKCRGTMKWVHTKCLNRWIDEKKEGNSMRPVICPQCRTQYIILVPQMGKTGRLIEMVDELYKAACPFIMAGVFVGSLYWSGVTFGAVTFMQVAGKKEALAVLKKSGPLVLMIALPTIPIGLILGQMIRWEEPVLHTIRRCSGFIRRITLMRSYLPHDEADIQNEETATNPSISEYTDPLLVFVGALILPTVSASVGRMIFHSGESTLYRTLFGGVTYLVVKGLLKLYLKHQQYKCKKGRSVTDYTEENIRRCRNRNPLIHEGSEERFADIARAELEQLDNQLQWEEFVWEE